MPALILCGITIVSCSNSAVAGPEAVDLGLSVKWATYNLGATSPEGRGDYFFWGETEPKKVYGEEHYKWYQPGSPKMIKYPLNTSHRGVDGLIELEMGDDAASVNWGAKWRMPNLAEIKELFR